MTMPVAIFADFNLDGFTIEDVIAVPIGGRLIRGHAPDHAVVRDVSVKAKRLAEWDSDHTAVLYTLTINGEQVRVIWWNCYVGNDPEYVAEVVAMFARIYDPHAIGLAEAYRCSRKSLRNKGYRLFKGILGEARGIAVLVRRDVTIERHGWLRMREAWIGPIHHLRKGPRRFKFLRLGLAGGGTLRALFGHLPTGGLDGRNADAVNESCDRLKDWAGRR